MKFGIENRTPQGTIKNRLLFSLIINDVYADIVNKMKVSPLADDGVIWKRGRNMILLCRKCRWLRYFFLQRGSRGQCIFKKWRTNVRKY